MYFGRWTNDTVPIPYEVMSESLRSFLVRDYADFAKMHPGKVIEVKFGRHPDGSLRRKIDVRFPVIDVL